MIYLIPQIQTDEGKRKLKPFGDYTEGKSYLPGDLWATVAHSLGIPLDIVHTSKRGRPMKLANGGTPIKELIG